MRHLALLAPLLAAACSEYDLQSRDDNPVGVDGSDAWDATGDDSVPKECRESAWPAEEVGVGDTCITPPEGGFTPIVEWDFRDSGGGCLALPVVADIDGDGLPEILVNRSPLFLGKGDLVVLHGDGSGVLWRRAAGLGYGSAPAVADLDADGSPEIIVVREYQNSMLQTGDYTAVAYDAAGTELWESAHFVGADFDYASAPSITDMDHDGSPEIVIGRVILDATGSTRGVGRYGRGSYGITNAFGIEVSEASVSAVADLDRDGIEEVITGNAAYRPDGTALWQHIAEDDGMIAIANLDADPEGEIIAVSYNTIRAMDTDGRTLWGPVTVASANILSVPAVGDLDGDGMVEIVTAGGNQLVAFNHDGTEAWTAAVTDESGATGASIFDFEGDGQPEVVYIDEVQMIAFDGATGVVKFHSDEHSSNTMMDYPVIADVDADGHAEIVVCHMGYASVMSVYGDKDNSWAPARKLWNQHAYTITNIRDDLTVPTTAPAGWLEHNTWHAAQPTSGDALAADVEAEIVEVCAEECEAGAVFVTGRILNRAKVAQAGPISAALYVERDGLRTALAVITVEDEIPAGWSSEAFVIGVGAAELQGADAVWLQADDDGTGTGAILECVEDNGFRWEGPFCP